MQVVEGVSPFAVADMMARLNDQQREAAKIIDGRVLVLAGAGSGKTSTLTTRLANMMVNGVKPWEIFCATFTNKAANEMKERLAKAVGEKNANATWMGTFHSLCVRILRKHGHILGYDEKNERCNFVIYDSYDTMKLIEKIYKAMGIEKDYKVGVAMGYIDSAKNNLWDPEHCMTHNAETQQEETMSLVYGRYQEALKASNAMDFGDLIMNVVVLLEDYPDVAKYWQEKFKYVLCDEYQDTNPAQFRLLTNLAAPQMNIFTVGDHDQSIYKFRGSDIGIIMSFERHFAPCQIIKLERNYRSTQKIVHAGNAVISNNKSPYDKVLKAGEEEGEDIHVIETENEYAEAAFVAAKIKQLIMQKDYNYRDFAILYRAGFQSQALEKVFKNALMPYKIVGGKSFWDREEVKDATSYLRAIANRKDNAALLRILNKPARGIGKTSQDAIEKFSNDLKISVHRALFAVEEIETIKKAARGKINTFLNILDHLEEKSKEMKSLRAFVAYVLDHTGLMTHYRQRGEKDPKEEEKIDNLHEFIRMVAHFEEEYPEATLEEFMQEMSLMTDIKVPDEEDENQEPNEVRFMTMHGSKGLEFPVVFGIGWNANVFPSWRSQSQEDLEEERRLAYVAITRAEKELYLTNMKQRQRPNGRGMETLQPSRFLDELPEEIVQKQKINLGN